MLGCSALVARRHERIEGTVVQHGAEFRVLHVAADIAFIDRVLRIGQARSEVPAHDARLDTGHHVLNVGHGAAVAGAPVDGAVRNHHRGHLGRLERGQVRQNVLVVQGGANRDVDRNGIGCNTGSQVEAAEGHVGKDGGVLTQLEATRGIRGITLGLRDDFHLGREVE